ncbi:MAG: alpha/beta fold hydrolase [Meiothermus sp.]|nr:alpha/beta fold hydrolase [Meiothermus sp.]
MPIETQRSNYTKRRDGLWGTSPEQTSPYIPAHLQIEQVKGNSLGAVQDFGCYEETTILSKGNRIVLSIWVVKPLAATVLFLPGTMTHPLFYRELLEGLGQAGFNVVGVHFVGHGKSPRVSGFTFEDLLQNARDALSYALHRFGGKVVVLGSSQGGILAMALAASDRRLSAVFAHNILDPEIPESLEVTRFPRRLEPHHRRLVDGVRRLAAVFPQFPVPLNFYLDPLRITRKPRLLRRLATDPLGLRSYPLRFLASLFSADLSGMYDGSIGCPVVVITSRGDPLFPFANTENLYRRIVAPSKELMVFDCGIHLIFNECLGSVLPQLVERLHRHLDTADAEFHRDRLCAPA